MRTLSVPGQIRAACARRAGAVGRCLPRCTPGGAGRSFDEPRGSRRARSMGRITFRKHWKCTQAICTVASATCNSHVLLHRQRLIVEVVHGVAAETVSRRCRHRTWQGAVNIEQCVSVQMRSDAVAHSLVWKTRIVPLWSFAIRRQCTEPMTEVYLCGGRGALPSSAIRCPLPRHYERTGVKGTPIADFLKFEPERRAPKFASLRSCEPYPVSPFSGER